MSKEEWQGPIEVKIQRVLVPVKDQPFQKDREHLNFLKVNKNDVHDKYFLF